MNVYFIRAGRKGPIKIGVAKNVKRRVETLQTGNHEPLLILAIIPCNGKALAYNLESQLHSIYSRDRIIGEWFKPIINFNIATEKLGLDLPKNELYEKLSSWKKLKRDKDRAKRAAKKVRKTLIRELDDIAIMNSPI